MKSEIIKSLAQNFVDYTNTTDSGVEFWFARNLQHLLGYTKWDNFAKVLNKAKTACEATGNMVLDHFVDVGKMVSLGSGSQRGIQDFMLTRYACYLVAQNGDPKKEAIAFAQNFEDYTNATDSGVEFWFARDLQHLLGCTKWDNFSKVLNKAKTACEATGNMVLDHFVDVGKMVSLGSDSQRGIQDFMLTRYACYLVAQNGDPKKEAIALAQNFVDYTNTTDSGVEFWFARNLQHLLGYKEWRNFSKAINKAKTTCEATGNIVLDHFVDVNKMVSIGSGAQKQIDDIMLTRYACYLVAQNGDPKKEAIAFAQNFEDYTNTTDSGVEFWFARDLQHLLGYTKWDNFSKVLNKAKTACEATGNMVLDHFPDVGKMVSIGSGAQKQIDDIMLTRYACYLVAQNGDPKKEAIAFAQNFEDYTNTTDSGVEFWFARNLQHLLGYTKWDNFSKVLNKAKTACEATGNMVLDHFPDVGKMVSIGSGAQKQRKVSQQNILLIINLLERYY